MSTQKPVSSTYSLRIPTCHCVLFPVLGAQSKFFLVKTRPENAFGMVGTEACPRAGGDWRIIRGEEVQDDTAPTAENACIQNPASLVCVLGRLVIILGG